MSRWLPRNNLVKLLPLLASPNKMATRSTAKKPYYRDLYDELGLIGGGVRQFGVGAPSLKILAKLKPLLSEATQRRVESEESGQMFQYGALRGDPVYLQGLTKFLSKHYNEPVCSDDLVCTAGATHGLLLMTSLLLRQGDYVFVEDPTYFIALKIFRDDLKMNTVVVPMDDEGVDVDAFDKMLTEYHGKFQETSEDRPYSAIFYTMPVFHNPTSKVLPAGKCSALIKVLRKHNVLAVCDDVYNIIHFGSDPPKRLFSYDKKSDPDYKGHVVSNGSFSKIVGPGMRLGWVEAPEIVVNKLIQSSVLISGGGVNQYTSAVMGAALQHNILSGYIQDIIEIYKSKMEAMCQALDKHLKPFIKYTKPEGGYFIWVELLEDCDVEDLQRYCMINHKVDFRPGPCFSLDCNFKNYIRLSFAYVEKDEIDKGIKDIADALKNFLKK